jgi:hypothetical protein
MLHQSTQRRLCRILFLALCLVPTLGLLAYAAWVRLPNYRHGWVNQLQTITGLHVTLADVQHPTPGATRLVKLSAHDPHTGELIAEVREINITQHAGGLRIAASQPQLQTRQLAALWRRLEDRFLHGISWRNDIELAAGEVTFVSPEGRSQTLTDVQARLRGGDTRSLCVEYRVAGVPMPRGAKIQVELTPRDDGPITKLSWHTGDAALPVAPWASRFPSLEQLGPRAEFRGEATAELGEVAWSASVRGELLRVDLDRLISDQFPHKLSGDAKFILDRAEVRGGHLVSATGRVEAGPGVIGDSLLDAAVQHWQWTKHAGAGTDSSSHDVRQRYTRLAAQLKLDGDTLQIVGACPSAADTILVSDEHATWRTPREKNVYAGVSLIRVLAGSGDVDVPATSGSRQLIRILPLPDRAENQEPTQPPRGHLRP